MIGITGTAFKLSFGGGGLGFSNCDIFITQDRTQIEGSKNCLQGSLDRESKKLVNVIRKWRYVTVKKKSKTHR